jgi:hypothetical protein
LSYSTRYLADKAGVSSAWMKNKAGAVVDSTIAAVTSALGEMTDDIKSDYLGAYVVNGNKSTSWPMCLASFVLIRPESNISDCSYITGLMSFIAWSQLNPHVITEVQDELGLVPLPFGYKTYVRECVSVSVPI